MAGIQDIWARVTTDEITLYGYLLARIDTFIISTVALKVMNQEPTIGLVFSHVAGPFYTYRYRKAVSVALGLLTNYIFPSVVHSIDVYISSLRNMIDDIVERKVDLIEESMLYAHYVVVPPERRPLLKSRIKSVAYKYGDIIFPITNIIMYIAELPYVYTLGKEAFENQVNVIKKDIDAIRGMKYTEIADSLDKVSRIAIDAAERIKIMEVSEYARVEHPITSNLENLYRKLIDKAMFEGADIIRRFIVGRK